VIVIESISVDDIKVHTRLYIVFVYGFISQ